jgi:hypothetical protein
MNLSSQNTLREIARLCWREKAIAHNPVNCKMSNHHRAIGVKDKGHGDHSETSLYDREGTSKKCKPDDAAITRSGSYRYSGMESTPLRVSRIGYAFRGSVTLTPFFPSSILLTVNSAFQPYPSLMTREVSFDAMRLLRLNLVLSSSLRQAREAAAVISSQRVAPIMPNHIYPVAASNQWSSMASFPFAMNNSTNHCNCAAEPFPRVLAQPTMGPVQARWVENQSSMMASRAGITENPVQVVQCLQQQQQTLRRDGTRHCERGSHGVSGFSCPSPRSIPQDLVVSNVTCAQLPAVLSCATDGIVLTAFQVVLRLHI